VNAEITGEIRASTEASPQDTQIPASHRTAGTVIRQHIPALPPLSACGCQATRAADARSVTLRRFGS
jgi:hypothetical protein